MATVFLLVGLPASGKTTVARRLAAEHRALRLTPDEWMIPLFGDSDADGKRDVLEGRLISLAAQAIEVGTNVVLDFGCWGRDERWALRSVFSDLGADFELVYLPVEPTAQLARIQQRWADRPSETFPISAADLAHWRASFEEPDLTELTARTAPGPPPPWESWTAWAGWRWPTPDRPDQQNRPDRPDRHATR